MATTEVRNASTAQQPNDPSPVTTHWANIEAHFKKHDEGSFKKYNDDMNTLLVFAGLYSAILTAFIIEFYKLLQADTGQTTVSLLSQMLGKLDDLSGGTQLPAASSNGADPSSAPFHPSRSSRWINVLWFLSLLLSLAAAFFAMVAKQWLREYLTWTSFSADPSEVVVLRQLRADALEKWHVPAIIGGIPALLELALVLFLCGIVVVLWTIDDVVAIAVTIFASIFLIAAVIVTILPTFSEECPYKSPLGWAVVLLWNKIIRILPKRALDHSLDLYRLAHISAKTWVRRDMCKMTGVPRLRAKRGALPGEVSVSAAEVLVVMAQALAWVRKDSERTVILNSVDHCMKTIHETANKLVTPSTAFSQHPKLQIVDRLNSAFLATCRLLGVDAEVMSGAVTETYTISGLPDRGTGRTGSSLWVKCARRRQHDVLVTLLHPLINSLSHPAHTDEDEKILITIRILVSALEHAAEYMFLHKDDGHTPSSRPDETGTASRTLSTTNRAASLRNSIIHHTDSIPFPTPSTGAALSFQQPRAMGPVLREDEQMVFMDIFCLVETIIMLHQAEHAGQHVTDYLNVITKIYRRLHMHQALDNQYPGLRTMIFQTLCMIGNPERVVPGWLGATDDRLGGLQLRNATERADRYAMLANQIFLSNTRYSRTEDRHMFVVIADQAFENCELLLPQTFQELIASATEASSLCVEHGWTNCGAYYDLPWVDTLLKNAKRLRSRFRWNFVSSLLTSLEKNMKEGLLDDRISPGIEQLKDLRRKFYPPRTEGRPVPVIIPIQNKTSSRRSSDPESLKWQRSMQDLKNFSLPFVPIGTPVAGTSNSPGTVFYPRPLAPSLRRPTSIPSFGTPMNFVNESPASAYYHPLLAHPPTNLLQVHPGTAPFAMRDNPVVTTLPNPLLISRAISDDPSHTPLPTPLPTPGNAPEDLPLNVDKYPFRGPPSNES